MMFSYYQNWICCHAFFLLLILSVSIKSELKWHWRTTQWNFDSSRNSNFLFNICFRQISHFTLTANSTIFNFPSQFSLLRISFGRRQFSAAAAKKKVCCSIYASMQLHTHFFVTLVQRNNEKFPLHLVHVPKQEKITEAQKRRITISWNNYFSGVKCCFYEEKHKIVCSEKSEFDLMSLWCVDIC